MKKLITMIGMGAVLCMVPACKKSNIIPREATASNETQQRGPGQALPQQENNTTMYVMLASKSCATPQKEYTSVIVDIRDIRVYSAEHGWEVLPTIVSGWDLVMLQQGAMPGLNITDRTIVNPGTITKVAITFGDNNKLVVNNKPVSCFKLVTQEVILDLKEEVKKGAVNELLIAMDICGNIIKSGQDPCYVLKPVVEFQRLSQKMIK